MRRCQRGSRPRRRSIAATFVLVGSLGVGLTLLCCADAYAHAAGTSVRAPTAPPLLGPQTAPQSGAEESSASATPSAGDVLADNGLGSPLCNSSSQLPEGPARSCLTSEFTASPDPTGDFAFDVNINTGAGSWSNDASSTLQDFAELGWMALVAMAHALVVMLEWCFLLDLTTDRAMSQATLALHGAGSSFTEPWTAAALAVAAALAAYHGLLRRGVAQTVGGALTMLAMMAVGLWMIASPANTVGVLARWSDEGAADTLGVMAGASEARPQATLASSVNGLFGSVIDAPWCYLEFGDVSWCEQASQLDPRLHRVAIQIAKRLRKACQAHCAASSSARARIVSAELLESAHANGQLFLALPADEVERNSTKTPGTLLNALCGGGESADRCSGPTAQQAEFRSERGTDGRLMGLAAIWLGALGMLLLFGLLALRLLIAAGSTLLYLLLVPAAALAPALGERGRAFFRNWGLRLLAATTSKLTYSFLLGVLLTVDHLLLSVPALGWWAQWCLMSAFWWTAFAKRHDAQALLSGQLQTLATPSTRPRARSRPSRNRYARMRIRRRWS
jgi:hypothetical protein